MLLSEPLGVAFISATTCAAARTFRNDAISSGSAITIADSQTMVLGPPVFGGSHFISGRNRSARAPIQLAVIINPDTNARFSASCMLHFRNRRRTVTFVPSPPLRLAIQLV